jgi:hypothetical protein
VEEKRERERDRERERVKKLTGIDGVPVPQHLDGRGGQPVVIV